VEEERFTPCIGDALAELLKERLESQATITTLDLLHALEKRAGGAHSALANLSYNLTAPPPEGTEEPGEMLFSTAVEDALEAAEERPVHSHHLLVAFLRNPESLAAKALRAQNITAERIQQLGGLEDPAPQARPATLSGVVLGFFLGMGICFVGIKAFDHLPALPPGLAAGILLGYLLASRLSASWRPVAAGPRRCARCSFSCCIGAAFVQNRYGTVHCLDCVRRGERLAQYLCTALTLGSPLAVAALLYLPGGPGTLLAGLLLGPFIMSASIVVHELGHALAARLMGSAATVTLGRDWLTRPRYRAFGFNWVVGWPSLEGYVTSLRMVNTLGAFALYLGGPLATALLAGTSLLLNPHAGWLAPLAQLTAAWNLIILVQSLVPYQTRVGIPSDGARLLSLFRRGPRRLPTWSSRSRPRRSTTSKSTRPWWPWSRRRSLLHSMPASSQG